MARRTRTIAFAVAFWTMSPIPPFRPLLTWLELLTAGEVVCVASSLAANCSVLRRPYQDFACPSSGQRL